MVANCRSNSCGAASPLPDWRLPTSADGTKNPVSQLYVNRGIGTTVIPIRLGARPEITVFELVRGV